MDRAESGEMGFDALIRDFVYAQGRRETLRRSLEIASQLLDLSATAHKNSLWLVYSNADPMRICWCGGDGWVIDPTTILGKTLPEAFGDEAAKTLLPHYKAGLEGEHAFDFLFEGIEWRSSLIPLRVEGLGVLGGGLLSRPLALWEGGGDPTPDSEDSNP